MWTTNNNYFIIILKVELFFLQKQVPVHWTHMYYYSSSILNIDFEIVIDSTLRLT